MTAIVWTVILAGLCGGLFGFLIGGFVVTLRDVVPLETELAHLEREHRWELHKQARTHRDVVAELHGRLAFYRALHRVADAVLTGVPLHDAQGAPELQVVEGSAS